MKQFHWRLGDYITSSEPNLRDVLKVKRVILANDSLMFKRCYPILRQLGREHWFNDDGI